jgi:predicted metal-dependent phosphoesterase TrpH
MNIHIAYEVPDIAKLRRDHFVADIHFHTRYSHDCSTPIPKVLERAKELGIYLAITDHNAIGGVLEAHKSALGRKLVIPGVEVTTKEGKDVLIYFYNLNDLKRFFTKRVKPHMKKKSSIRSNRTKYSIHDLLDDLVEERCVVVLPHPIGAKTRASYGYFQRKKNNHLLDYIDVIEVINETMTHKANLASLGWAVQLGKPISAGSDGHTLKRLGEAVVAAKAKNKNQFLDALRDGKTVLVGKELRFRQRVGAYLHIVKEKARVRKNRRVSR